jgi:uncharacterized phage protein (TIGR02218 family)
LGGDATTLATCVKITRLDAQVFGFTEHDDALTIGGVTYQSMQGIQSTGVDSQSGLNVDQLDVKGMLDLLGVDEADIVSGRWDFAVIRVFAVNWADLTMGDYKLRRGTLGQLSVTNCYIAEMRGVTQWLQQTIGELASPMCKADLFDDRCKVNPAAYTVSGTVGTVTNPQRAWTDAALVQATGYFTAGKVTWVTGANAGLSMEVKSFGATAVGLQEPMPYVIAPGDTYSIKAGCLKRFVEDCGNKFNNQDNFRGLPFLPGLDRLLAGV